MKTRFTSIVAIFCLVSFSGFTPRRVLIEEVYAIQGPSEEVLSYIHIGLISKGAHLLTVPGVYPALYELPNSRERLTIVVTDAEMKIAVNASLRPGCSRMKAELGIYDFIRDVGRQAEENGAPRVRIERKSDMNFTTNS